MSDSLLLTLILLVIALNIAFIIYIWFWRFKLLSKTKKWMFITYSWLFLIGVTKIVGLMLGMTI